MNQKGLGAKNSVSEKRCTQREGGTRLPIDPLESTWGHLYSSFFRSRLRRSRAALQRGTPWQIPGDDTNNSILQLVTVVKVNFGRREPETRTLEKQRDAAPGVAIGVTQNVPDVAGR